MKWWHKLWRHEYWPSFWFYLPVFGQWIGQSLRAGSGAWPVITNPSIYYSGLIGESKKEVLDLLPEEVLPVTLNFDAGVKPEHILSQYANFPLILKPDVGERGKAVALIRNEEELGRYLKSTSNSIQLQEYLTGSCEAGIFYIRMPWEQQGVISSLVCKEFLQVVGDGSSSIEALMRRIPRARFQIARLGEYLDLDLIPAAGETVLLEPIGNHSRGTIFRNRPDLLTESLSREVNAISRKIPGFYYGRFDVKAADEAALMRGEFKVMELNGISSEPGHVFDPDYPLWQSWKDMLWHWRQMYRIARYNHSRGIAYPASSPILEEIEKSLELRQKA